MRQYGPNKTNFGLVNGPRVDKIALLPRGDAASGHSDAPATGA